MLKNRINSPLLVSVSLAAGFGGTAMSLTAAVWVKTLTGSSGLAALAGFFVYAPTLLGPVLGPLVDRWPAKPLLIATNLGLAALLLTLLTVHSGDQVWLVYAVMLGRGVGAVLVDAAEVRLLTEAVPATDLGGLNGARMSAQEGTKLLAPLVGAGIFVASGGPTVAVLSAGCLVVAAALYPLVRSTVAAHPAESTVDEGSTERRSGTGLRFLWTQPGIRIPVLVATVAMLGSSLGEAPLYSVVDGLGRPPAFIGVLSSVQGAGAIVSGLAVGCLLRRLGETAVGALGAVVFALGPLAQATGSLPLIIAGSAFVGIGLPWTVVAAFTAVQLRTPHGIVGRVSASAGTLVFAAPALGLPVGAALVSLVDYRLLFVVGAGGALAAALLARRAARSPTDQRSDVAESAITGTPDIRAEAG